MSFQSLDTAGVYDVEYIENEKILHIDRRSILMNLDDRNGDDITFYRGACSPFCSAVLMDITVNNIKKALIIRDFDKYDMNDPEVTNEIKKRWKSLWDYTHLERNRNVPYYKSPQLRVGGNITMNFCYAEKMYPSGMHRTHPVAIDETHLQVAGIGKVQKFRNESPDSLYQEYILTPGMVNEKMCDEEGGYPWHRYMSVTNLVFVCVEREI